jgi:hypothetical protein
MGMPFHRFSVAVWLREIGRSQAIAISEKYKTTQAAIPDLQNLLYN